MREASSEHYGPRVYFTHYIFRSTYKNTKNTLLHFYLFIYIYLLSLSDLTLQVIVKGLTTRLSHWVHVCLFLRRCLGASSWYSYWIDTLVLKLSEILISTLLHHPFLLKGKTNASSRSSRKNFWRRCRGVFKWIISTKYLSQTHLLHLHYFPFASRFPLPHS